MAISNNKAYQAYDHLINGFIHGDIARGPEDKSNKQLMHGAASLAVIAAANPFEHGTRAAYLYFRILFCYRVWQKGGVGSRVNRRRMFEAAAELAAMGLPNPFLHFVDPYGQADEDDSILSLEALAEAEHEQTIAVDIASGTYVPVQEPMHIMGILPDEEDE